MIVVPLSELKPEVLQGVIEEFVLREGTEYGVSDVPLERKVEQVLKQLQQRRAQIVFDEESKSCTIVPIK